MNFKVMGYESTIFNLIVANKSHCVTQGVMKLVCPEQPVAVYLSTHFHVHSH